MSSDKAKTFEALEDRCRNMPEIPEFFYEWSKAVFPASWCFYKRRKNHADLFCCKCGKSYTIRTKARESYEGTFETVYDTPVHDTFGTCKECGASVRFVSGIMRKDYYYDKEVVLIGQKYQEKGYVLRNFEVTRTYGRERKEKYNFNEIVRSFYIPGKRKIQEDWKKWDWYAGEDYWDYSGYGGLYKQMEHAGHIFPDTYRSMKGTCLEYCMVQEYYAHMNRPFSKFNTYFNDLRNYLNAYFRYPIIEVLVKMRAYKMVNRMEYTWRTNIFNINNRAKTPYDMLRVRKKRFKPFIKEPNDIKLSWYQYEYKNGMIDDEIIEWMSDSRIDTKTAEKLLRHMSPKQIMNYLIRQKEEQYKKFSYLGIVQQYEDYINMCIRLGKDITDEMIYRPRQLKRRHDEAVAEIERLNVQLKADEYSKKFGEAEKVLGLIREKFEYVGEGFFIKVPEKIVDIVSEGNYLHHCAGATDRYFDRIKSHETYICFLRKVEEPDIPFYTIEVEPGGTIRQHRGMYDEEPELDLVKPFLREWQKEIKKRMSKKDHELAAVSKQKREENIAELKAKNNTRVLQGLLEDFMEAM